MIRSIKPYFSFLLPLSGRCLRGALTRNLVLVVYDVNRSTLNAKKRYLAAEDAQGTTFRVLESPSQIQRPVPLGNDQRRALKFHHRLRYCLHH
jgi:TRAP-type C4-dicarboxylate transport system substrate-binding protein